MAKYCSNCGSALNEKGMFCGKCGTKVDVPQQSMPKTKIKGRVGIILKITFLLVIICAVGFGGYKAYDLFLKKGNNAVTIETFNPDKAPLLFG